MKSEAFAVATNIIFDKKVRLSWNEINVSQSVKLYKYLSAFHANK